MSRFRRKGRNMGPVDEWLDSLGYYRKNVAYDETCLFRSISEQLFACQLYHERIRKDCISYAECNHHEFTYFQPNIRKWKEHLEKLEKHMVICSDVEIDIISKTYRKNVILIDGNNRTILNIINAPFKECFLLCHMGEDHYDVVYRKEYIQDSGFCQSIVYNSLYADVFGLNRVDEIVDTMLYQKPNSTDDQNNNAQPLKYENIAISYKECNEEKTEDDYDYMMKTRIAPFPFKVAKAIDPSIYRNIEYDNWTEMRKELRLGEWYYGDNNLIRGSACIFKDNGVELQCYIQEILENNRCVIYITSHAEKRTVNMSELRPEENAKPWPLPYRFSKNLVLNIPKIELPEKKSGTRRKDKRNARKEINHVDRDNENNLEIKKCATYKGVPLQMQMENSTYYEQNATESQSNDQQQYLNWEYSANSTTNNSVSENQESDWGQSGPADSSTDGNNNNGAYPTEEYNYCIWPAGEFITPVPNTCETTPSIDTPENFNSFFFSDGSTYSPAYSNQAPFSPQVEMYHPPVFQMQPGTPVLLAPMSAGNMPEMMVPISPHMQPLPVYNPLDLSPQPIPQSPFVFTPAPTSPYVYPPVSPVWYPTMGVNSNGFIFPTAPQTNTQPAYSVGLPQQNQ